MNNKKYLIYSTISFILGFIAMDVINGKLRNFDKYHFLLLAPIVFPVAGLTYSIVVIRSSSIQIQIAAVLLLLVNLGLAAIIFMTYSFSYWQF